MKKMAGIITVMMVTTACLNGQLFAAAISIAAQEHEVCKIFFRLTIDLPGV